MNFEKLSQIVGTQAKVCGDEFLISDGSIEVKSIQLNKALDAIIGPGIEVCGEKMNYSCVLEYEAKDNDKILDFIFSRFPFINRVELPEIDILDALGEYLNILCGKINAEVESDCPDLHIEVPYFVYGLEPKDNKVSAFSLVGADVSLNLYFYLS